MALTLLSETRKQTLRSSRWLSLLELTLVVAVFAVSLAGLLSTNVLTPFLFVLGWISLWLRGIGWQGAGLRRPAHLGRTVLIGVAVGVGYQFFSIYVEESLLVWLVGTKPDVSQFDALEGNLAMLLIWLVLAWTFAAFGEEMAYRGYWMRRLAGVAGEGRWAWGMALALSSIAFGLAHLYQGIAGVLSGLVAGLLLGSLYLASGRNLWLPIIAHGTWDTIGLVFLYLGWFR